MTETLRIIIKGHNLQALRNALKRGQVRSLQVFDSDRWAANTARNEAVIQSFELDEALEEAGTA
ncbi:MAG TPA: hypothetical protein VIY49_01300 [Bryobacteraceae bacterium]